MAASTAHLSQWPALPPHPLVSAQTEGFVDQLLTGMSLEDKVGQMVQADIAFIKPEDLHRYRLGAVLAGGLSAPGGNVRSSPAAWSRLVSEYRKAALEGGSSAHPAIPILFGIDAVHGNAKIPGATVFPHNIGLGATHDPDLIRRIAEATAQEVAAVGLDWAFSPTIAVAQDPRWGRAYESYSASPNLVAAYASAMVTGLQGSFRTADYFAPGHVLSSAKHFIGDGGTQAGRDQGDTVLPEAMLRDVHGAAYRAAIAAGVGTIMASYNSWNGEKMHANASLLTGVLKQRWQFSGFVIGDWDAQEEIPGCTKSSCAQAVNAGIDMVMAPDSWKQMYESLLQQARSGEIPAGRIDDAVRRILRVKATAGLIGPGARPAGAGNLSVIGSPAHRALAREAVRDSLVLLKNNGGLLPIPPGRHILVVGEAADQIAEQCGGWTVDWQGANNTNADFAGATSIFAGIKAAAKRTGGSAELSRDGSFRQKPDVAILVFGEHPYAEFEGDRETLALPQSRHVLENLRALRARHIPTVSVLLSGRPLWINPELNLSDAFVAAWLPGSEGEGVADLLFRAASGAPQPDFSGRLGFAWPSTAMPAAGDAETTLFNIGFGLDLKHPATLGLLSEDPSVPPEWNTIDTFYGEGHVVAPWSVYVTDTAGQVRLTRGEQGSPAGAVQAIQQNEMIEAEWSGKANGVWWIGDTVTDLSALAASGTVLSVTYRVLKQPTAKVVLGMQCGDGCSGWLDVTGELRKPAAADWRTLRIKISCFGFRGADLHRISVPFAFATTGKAAITIKKIALAPDVSSTGCPAA